MADTLIEVKNLKKLFPAGGGLGKKSYIYANDDISFSIEKGETLGLVGESGCGKSTLGRTILRLYEPSAGSIFYRGHDISRLPHREIVRSTKMQMIFQDP